MKISCKLPARRDAEAIHPGYGFLSESPAFAQAVRTAGLIFIGPPPEAIDAMGDKGRARERVQASGVPVVPGYQGPDDEQTLMAQAAKIGYPTVGEGGRGWRREGDARSQSSR